MSRHSKGTLGSGQSISPTPSASDGEEQNLEGKKQSYRKRMDSSSSSQRRGSTDSDLSITSGEDGLVETSLSQQERDPQKQKNRSFLQPIINQIFRRYVKPLPADVFKDYSIEFQPVNEAKGSVLNAHSFESKRRNSSIVVSEQLEIYWPDGQKVTVAFKELIKGLPQERYWRSFLGGLLNRREFVPQSQVNESSKNEIKRLISIYFGRRWSGLFQQCIVAPAPESKKARGKILGEGDPNQRWIGEFCCFLGDESRHLFDPKQKEMFSRTTSSSSNFQGEVGDDSLSDLVKSILEKGDQLAKRFGQGDLSRLVTQFLRAYQYYLMLELKDSGGELLESKSGYQSSVLGDFQISPKVNQQLSTFVKRLTSSPLFQELNTLHSKNEHNSFMKRVEKQLVTFDLQCGDLSQIHSACFCRELAQQDLSRSLALTSVLRSGRSPNRQKSQQNKSPRYRAYRPSVPQVTLAADEAICSYDVKVINDKQRPIVSNVLAIFEKTAAKKQQTASSAVLWRERLQSVRLSSDDARAQPKKREAQLGIPTVEAKHLAQPVVTRLNTKGSKKKFALGKIKLFADKQNERKAIRLFVKEAIKYKQDAKVLTLLGSYLEHMLKPCLTLIESEVKCSWLSSRKDKREKCRQSLALCQQVYHDLLEKFQSGGKSVNLDSMLEQLNRATDVVKQTFSTTWFESSYDAKKEKLVQKLENVEAQFRNLRNEHKDKAAEEINELWKKEYGNTELGKELLSLGKMNGHTANQHNDLMKSIYKAVQKEDVNHLQLNSVPDPVLDELDSEGNTPVWLAFQVLCDTKKIYATELQQAITKIDKLFAPTMIELERLRVKYATDNNTDKQNTLEGVKDRLVGFKQELVSKLHKSFTTQSDAVKEDAIDRDQQVITAALTEFSQSIHKEIKLLYNVNSKYFKTLNQKVTNNFFFNKNALELKPMQELKQLSEEKIRNTFVPGGGSS